MFTLKEIILSETKLALGCTEPAAIALNASYLREYINTKKIVLTINTNLLKNAMYVPIPNTNREFGVEFAFALGYICGNKKDELNIFKNLNSECIQKAKEFMKNIELRIIEGNTLFIKSEAEGYEVITKHFHDNISFIKTPTKILKNEYKNIKNNTNKIEEWLKNQNFEKLLDLLENENDFLFIQDLINTNIELANYGLNNDCGLNIGKNYEGNDVLSKLLAHTVSASDARMEGVNLPAMSLVGSGNHGISATLPVWIYGKEKNYPINIILKALAYSMLVTIYVKLYIGRLSPICGAALASGCGVAAAISYMETKNFEVSKRAIMFVIQTINGVICDGAKIGCALKVELGTKVGYESAMNAIKNKPIVYDGIIERDITKSIHNLKKISKAMFGVDGSIVEIMKNKII